MLGSAKDHGSRAGARRWLLFLYRTPGRALRPTKPRGRETDDGFGLREHRAPALKRAATHSDDWNGFLIRVA